MRFAAFRRLGFRKTPIGLRPLWCFAPPQFFAPVKMLRIFPYRAQKTVAYSRNVVRHTATKIYATDNITTGRDFIYFLCFKRFQEHILDKQDKNHAPTAQ
jgi:hypothetical protein